MMLLSARLHRPARTLQAFTAVATVIVGSRFVMAADELPFPISTTRPEPDGFLAKKIESALAAEPSLVDARPVISVVDGVAVIGGPVPEASLIPRIEEVVKRVPGLVTVKVTCWAPAAIDPFPKMVADRLKLSSAPPLALAPVRTESPKPVAEFLPSLPVSPPSTQVTVEKHAGPPADGFLLAPEAVKNGQSMAARPAYSTIPPQAVPTVPVSVSKVTDPVTAIRNKNPRYARLNVRVVDGVATISGQAAHPDDAWDLADELRRVPNLRRVVVGYVR